MDGVSEPCPIAWCDQGGRPHTRHEVTLGTWPGMAYSGGVRPMSAQLVVHGYGDEDVRPMVTLVDSASLDQVDCVLEWPDATELGRLLVGAAERHQPT